MANDNVTIQCSGSYSIKRHPELCDATFTVQHESLDKAEALTVVKQTVTELSTRLRAMAPPREELTGTVDIADEWPVRTPERPLTKWSIQRLNTYSFNPDVTTRHGAVSTRTEQGPKKHVVQTSLSTSWHNFEEMETFVSEVSANEHVSVGNMSWRISTHTKRSLQTAVRQGAVRDAIAKANDYASALASDANTTMRVKPVEINDGSHGHTYNSSAMPMRAMAFKSGGGQDREPPLNFEPEAIDVSSSVDCKFAVL